MGKFRELNTCGFLYGSAQEPGSRLMLQRVPATIAADIGVEVRVIAENVLTKRICPDVAVSGG